MSRTIPHLLATGKIELCRLLDKTSSRQAPPKGPPGFSHTYLSFGNASIPTAKPAFPHSSSSSMSTVFELLQGCDDLAYTCKLVMPHARVHTHKSHTARLAEVEYLGNLIINVNRVNHEILLDLRPSVVHVKAAAVPSLLLQQQAPSRRRTNNAAFDDAPSTTPHRQYSCHRQRSKEITLPSQPQSHRCGRHHITVAAATSKLFAIASPP